MAYTSNMKAAAVRLYESADRLHGNGQRHVAAYLFGLAAECALKHVAAGIPTGGGGDLQWLHFPELRSALRKLLSGRSADGLRRLVERQDFLNQWEIRIRYARKEDINDKPIDEWKAHACEALGIMMGR